MVCKLVLPTETENRTFACVHSRYLLCETFPNGDRQTQLYFNVSTPSSRRDNRLLKIYATQYNKFGKAEKRGKAFK